MMIKACDVCGDPIPDGEGEDDGGISYCNDCAGLTPTKPTVDIRSVESELDIRKGTEIQNEEG